MQTAINIQIFNCISTQTSAVTAGSSAAQMEAGLRPCSASALR